MLLFGNLSPPSSLYQYPHHYWCELKLSESPNVFGSLLFLHSASGVDSCLGIGQRGTLIKYKVSQVWPSTLTKLLERSMKIKNTIGKLVGKQDTFDAEAFVSGIPYPRSNLTPAMGSAEWYDRILKTATSELHEADFQKVLQYLGKTYEELRTYIREHSPRRKFASGKELVDSIPMSRLGSIPEWNEAQWLESILTVMQVANVAPEITAEVFEYLGMSLEEMDNAIAYGYHVMWEIREELYGGQG